MFSKILRFFKKDLNPANTPEGKNRILEAIARGETLEAIALIAAEGHRDALLWHAQWVSGEKAFQAGDLQAEAWFRTQNRINHAILMYCNPEQPAPDDNPAPFPDVPVTQEQCVAITQLIAQHQTAEALEICRHWGVQFLLVNKRFQEGRRMWHLGIIEESRWTELQNQVHEALLHLLESHPRKDNQ